ncbi:MAG TPA: hypothetical protein VMT67_17930 [Terriglobales bacterium]|nr:hypothetical protein [Terriglobales bacterium]
MFPILRATRIIPVSAIFVLLTCCAIPMLSQQTIMHAGVGAEQVVPSLVKFTGTLSSADGKPLSGTQGVTFLLYKDETGGAPLWMETQNVQADKNGRYSVTLGAANAHGLPADVFMTGEARWLAVQASGLAEQARALLVSVPYALKAGDAETLGGKPASAFLAAAASGQQGEPKPQIDTNEIFCASGTACKTAFVPVFASSGGNATITDSILSQSGSTLKIAGSETATGNISASGSITATGSLNTSASINAAGEVYSSYGVVAPWVSTTTTVGGVNATMTGTANGIGAIQGSATATGAAGFTFGVIGQSASDQGRGVFGLATGATGVGVIGETNSTGIGVVGKSLTPQGLAFAATGNVQQDRGSGGWVKALLYVNTEQAPYTIQRCFNSTLIGSAATTAPCGFNLVEEGPGVFHIDFGFEVDDRFVNATAYGDFALPWMTLEDSHTFQIVWYNVLHQQVGSGEYYWLAIY